MRRIILVIIATILILPPVAASAAQTATITVPEAGDHYYWFTYADVKGEQVATVPSGFRDKKTTVDLPLVKDAVPECTLFVLDAETGNEAVLSVKPEADKPVKFELKSSDFDKIRRIEVAVTSASTGEPAAAGSVKIEDSGKKLQTQVLDPSAKGVAQFTDVAAGTVKVTVQYGEGKTTSQDVDVSLDRQETVPRVEIPVVGEIETVEAAAPAGGEEEGTPRERTGRSIDFATALVGLILLVGIVYLAAVTMRSRGANLRGLLRKVGVQVPEEPQEEAAAPSEPAPQVDPSICPFCGNKKDPATGACACSLESAAAPSTGDVGTGPRLIATQGAYAGNTYALEAETATIGRDETNTIALSQDNTVSRRHARITSSDGEFKIYDEGSSNGTFVNGVKVVEQVLHPGDEIQIGNTRLRFET